MAETRLTFKASLLALIFISGIAPADNANLVMSAIATYDQRKPSIPQLQRAAETNDKEAQFYLAEALRLLSGHITPEARSWYEESAKQGDIYSMYRLSTLTQDLCNIIGNCTAYLDDAKKWGALLLLIAQGKAEQGDGEGMEMMYTLTGDLEWLQKSAAAGYPSAQHWLAVRYDWGDGWFFWPGQRQKEIERLYKASAKNGNPRSISKYAAALLIKGDIEGAQEWLMKGVAASYVPAVGAYAYNLEYGIYYHFEKDLQLAYALNLILSEIGEGDTPSDYSLEQLKPRLTPEQIIAATQQAKEWKQLHPPLSYYPPKLVFIR